mmetsp:Transcript_16180/g.25896  ORF Transcript_16180/g.25896 Transcript_16180/m.25896 type:complete len:115 (-) Transcript_16180:1473-1817(-)
MDIVTKITHRKKNKNPRGLLNFQPNIDIEPMTQNNIANNNARDISSPLVPTSMDEPLMRVNKNQGNGKPMVTSKIFEPRLDEIAMSPLPSLVTMMLSRRSGTEVPIASMVRPVI